MIFRGPGGFDYGSYSISDVQETVDSNMLFIAEVNLPGAGPESGSHFEIVKFNWEGEILGKIESRKEGDNQAIVQDEQGDIYFYNSRAPFMLDTIDFWGSSNAGGISKINSEMDSVLWSLSLRDSDMVSDLRSYRVFGINQLKDGNLLATGIAKQILNNADEELAFVCKFTKAGEVLWVREYGYPIPEEYLDLSYFGVLGTSRLVDCKELEDGRILCIGSNAYEKPELSFFSELWVLMLDENGCLTPNCEPSTILTSTSQTIDLQQGKIYPNPVSDVLTIADVSFDTYKIHDLTGRLIQEGSFATEIELNPQISSGLYVLQLKEEGKLKSVFKFLKE